MHPTTTHLLQPAAPHESKRVRTWLDDLLAESLEERELSVSVMAEDFASAIQTLDAEGKARVLRLLRDFLRQE